MYHIDIEVVVLLLLRKSKGNVERFNRNNRWQLFLFDMFFYPISNYLGKDRYNALYEYLYVYKGYPKFLRNSKLFEMGNRHFINNIGLEFYDFIRLCTYKEHARRFQINKLHKVHHLRMNKFVSKYAFYDPPRRYLIDFLTSVKGELLEYANSEMGLNNIFSYYLQSEMKFPREYYDYLMYFYRFISREYIYFSTLIHMCGKRARTQKFRVHDIVKLVRRMRAHKITHFFMGFSIKSKYLYNSCFNPIHSHLRGYSRGFSDTRVKDNSRFVGLEYEPGTTFVLYGRLMHPILIRLIVYEDVITRYNDIFFTNINSNNSTFISCEFVKNINYSFESLYYRSINTYGFSFYFNEYNSSSRRKRIHYVLFYVKISKWVTKDVFYVDGVFNSSCKLGDLIIIAADDATKD